MQRCGCLALLAVLLVSLSGCSKPITIVKVMGLPEITVQAGDYLPELPKQVEVTYSNNQRATLPIEKWNTEELQYARLWDDTVVTGTITGTKLTATEQILVAVDRRPLRLSDTELASNNWADAVEGKLESAKSPLGIISYAFSPDKSMVGYIISSDGTAQDLVYLWKAGEATGKAAPVEGGPFHTIEWSFDGKYCFGIASTDVIVGVDVIDASKNELRTSINSFMKAFWAPSSHELLVNLPNKLKTVVEIGNGCSYDLAIYSADTGATKVILPGTADSICSIVGWDGPNTVLYNKSDLVKGTEQTGLRLTITR